MAEEVKPEIIKKTQTALNKYIKKPPLTEKLLKKPPFRFLHDIVTSVIRETGFLEGVFTPEELVADNVKDRDSKVKFLTKLINAVKQATGNSIKAKPGKIVAGLEVDKTLELLQAIAKGVSVKSNGKKAGEANAKDKKKSKESTEENDKKNEKKDVKEKGKLKDSSPANSIEKQPSQEDGVTGAEKRRGSSGTEDERKRSKERSSAKKRENGEAIDEPAGVDKTRESKREGSARPKENRELAVEEALKKDGERRSGRRRDSISARTKENGEVAEEAKNGDAERRSGRRRDSISARTKENGEVVEEAKNGDAERRSGRRRDSISARTKENGEVAEEAKNGDAERRSGRRRDSISARTKENGESVEEIKGGGDVERRSGRRRESSSGRTKESGETLEETKGDAERKSGRRRERSSTGGREAQQEPAGEEKMVNGEGSSPPRRRSSSLRKSLSGDSQEKAEEEESSHRRPQTRRAASRSSKGPLKVFSEKEGKSLELKEEDEEPAKKKSAAGGPISLGSGEAVPRPPSALERPRTARRAPPSARPASGRTPVRPPSAVPGAPRARDRGEVQQDINKDQAESEIKEVVVITENDKEEDKEEMVVVENPSLQLNEVENLRDDMSSVVEGALVDSILETQSELEKRKTKAQVDIEWEGGKGRRSAAWEKDCARLREGVQGLTRAAGPLGKLFDFLQEDVDLASRELATWRKAGASFAQQLHAEQRLTEETLSRHKKKLSELEALIEEQHEAIRSLKSSILNNEKKIQSHISRFPAR